MPRLKTRAWLRAKATRTPTRRPRNALTYCTATGQRYVYNGHTWKRHATFWTRFGRVSAFLGRWTGHVLLWSTVGLLLGVALIFVLFGSLWLFLAILTAF